MQQDKCLRLTREEREAHLRAESDVERVIHMYHLRISHNNELIRYYQDLIIKLLDENKRIQEKLGQENSPQFSSDRHGK